MGKIKLTKENIGISLILILSAILNFANIGIEGYANSYYAAGVKSMLMNFKNFFFVSFDPAGFVTIDKPPLGFWIQTIFAKIFGFSGWSILLPEALAGVISVWLIYYLVKRSFGTAAGLISALCLSVTPVFVVASRNNTIDNLLVVTLLFACWALLIAAEKGKVKYLMISLVLVGVGFNIKMLEAYMVGPAFYITYLLSTVIPFKKRIKHLVLGTVILLTVSLSWAVVVDLVPAQDRPYVGSSTNNSVMELILGHNGLERLGLGGNSGPGGMGQGMRQRQAKTNTTSSITKENSSQETAKNNSESNTQGKLSSSNEGQGMPGGFASGNMPPPSGNRQGGGPGGQGGLQGSFGGQTTAGITRLFSKNILSDQIVWFIPFAILGFIIGAIKEKLTFKLDNQRKLSLAVWITWLIPEFVYFSYTTGLFHPYYLTMMAPPAAALAGIGISSMWQFYKEGGWKAWFLPISFIVDGLTQLLMLSYFSSSMSTPIRNIILGSLILCFVASGILAALNILKNDNELEQTKNLNLKKVLVIIAFIGILVTPFIGSSATITHQLNGTIPSGGLELLSGTHNIGFGGGNDLNNSNTKLVQFLQSNNTNEKYSLVVSSSNSAQDMIIKYGEPIMTLGGFSGSDNILTLAQFKELVSKGEVRYVLTGGMGGGSNSNIMNWVSQNGKVVPESQWKDSTTINNQSQNNANLQNKNSIKNSNSIRQNFGGFGGRNSEQLYDLKGVFSASN
jgi:4-amino-4-deoxy-L-arabinose transferase-like glycosyltransferase